jgi:RNA polymerase sigma factor (sigma-70 family)
MAPLPGNSLHDADRAIVDEVRGGEVRRYALLVDRHKDRAMTLAVRLVGNREEAEELVQDAFVRAFKNLAQFRGDSSFGTWFYRVLYNLCMTKVTRRPARRAMIDLDDDQVLDSIGVAEADISIQEKMEEEELQSLIALEIEHLPGKFKLALTLFYVQEMSYEEMAEVLQQPLGTVKTILFRGRNLLRKKVLARTKGEVKAT